MLLLLLSDLEEMGNSVLNEFSVGLTQLDQEKKETFDRQVQRLEAKLEQLYAVAATMARRESKLEDVVAIWERMVSICDRIAQTVNELQRKHAVTSATYDRILDLRNACEENRALHA